jgi:hypothetical protein
VQQDDQRPLAGLDVVQPLVADLGIILTKIAGQRGHICLLLGLVLPNDRALARYVEPVANTGLHPCQRGSTKPLVQEVSARQRTSVQS